MLRDVENSIAILFKHYDNFQALFIHGKLHIMRFHPISVNLPSFINRISAEAPENGTSSATAKRRS